MASAELEAATQMSAYRNRFTVFPNKYSDSRDGDRFWGNCEI